MLCIGISLDTYIIYSLKIRKTGSNCFPVSSGQWIGKYNVQSVQSDIFIKYNVRVNCKYIHR